MSRAKRTVREQHPIYQRGAYKLFEREDRRNLQIVWYDEQRKRERSVSAGTSDVATAKEALDTLYLKSEGHDVCPTCFRPYDGEASPLITRVIMDYLIKMEGREGEKSAQNRLTHVVNYVAETNPATRTPAIDERWIARFRAYMRKKDYAPGYAEGCVLQLAAAINSTRGQQAQFKAKSLKAVANSPIYRADIPTIASMFRFCIDPPGPNGREWSEKERAMVVARRLNLLRYLRAAVATWARPDAIMDLKAKGQWYKAAGVLNLNPPGREQTKKHRPMIPVARQFVPWLDEAMERRSYLPVTTIKHGWSAMQKKLGLPGERESGEKLIRRSIATIARKRIGEANWVQGEMMLGHVKARISDIYAIPDPANLGLALRVTEEIIDEIEALAPGAFSGISPHFHRTDQNESHLQLVVND